MKVTSSHCELFLRFCAFAGESTKCYVSPEKTSSFLKRYVLFYLIRQPHSLTALPCVSLPWEQLRKTGDRKRFFWRSPWFPPVYRKYLSGNSLEVELLLHTHLSVWKSTFSGFIQIKIQAFDLKLSLLNSIPCKIHKYLIEQLSLKSEDTVWEWMLI